MSQAKERDKDRLEQRREAKIQTREKWIEHDILKIMDSIEIVLKLFSSFEKLVFQYEYLENRKMSGKVKTKLTSIDNELINVHNEADFVLNTTYQFVFSFAEEEILKSFDNFLSATQTYFVELLEYNESKSNGESPEKNNINFVRVSQAAGKLQEVLREKLISLRE